MTLFIVKTRLSLILTVFLQRIAIVTLLMYAMKTCLNSSAAYHVDALACSRSYEYNVFHVFYYLRRRRK